MFAATVRSLAIAASLAMSAPAFAQASPEKAVQQVIAGQIDAFRQGAHEEAFRYAAPSIRGLFGSTDRFIAMVRQGYGAIYGAERYEFGRNRVTRDTILQEVRIVGPQGRDWVAIYTLRRQDDGGWKIAGVQMQEAEAKSI